MPALAPASGGYGTATNVTQNIIFQGETAGFSKLTFMQAGATDFARIINYGHGGDAANTIETGGQGGYRIINAGLTQNAYAMMGLHPGGGGGADSFGGYYSGGGRIIIHW